MALVASEIVGVALDDGAGVIVLAVLLPGHLVAVEPDMPADLGILAILEAHGVAADAPLARRHLLGPLSSARRSRLADEIQRLQPGAALERAMLDYARLRDQARACGNRPKAP